MCGIFAIGSYHRAVLSNIHGLGVEVPERPTMTTTESHDIRYQTTESHSETTWLCNVTSDRADGVGHAASKIYRHTADAKEAGELRDEHGAVAE